jgi:hypothetical protein
MYTLKKGCEKGGPLRLQALAKRLHGVAVTQDKGQYTPLGIYSFWIGLMYGLKCFFEPGSLIMGYPRYEATRLPAGFAQLITNDIAGREKAANWKPFFESMLAAIDNHFQEVEAA